MLNRKTANINVKTEFIYDCYRPNQTLKTAKVRPVNLVAEHVDICATKFTGLIFAVMLTRSEVPRPRINIAGLLLFSMCD